jgi:hypothetical protein
VVKVGEETLAGMTEEELYRSSLQINLAGVLSDIGKLSLLLRESRTTTAMYYLSSLNHSNHHYSGVLSSSPVFGTCMTNKGRYGESEKYLRSSLRRHLSSSSSFVSRTSSSAESSGCDDGGCGTPSVEADDARKYDEGTFKHMNKLAKLLLWLGKYKEADEVLRECTLKMEVRRTTTAASYYACSMPPHHTTW